MKYSIIFAFSLLLGSGLALPNLRYINETYELEPRQRQTSPFVEFNGCKPSYKDAIIKAWEDVEKIVKVSADFNLDAPFLDFMCKGICATGPLETRFWGKDIAKRIDAIKLIRKVFTNIRDLNNKAAEIQISCIDQPDLSVLPENRAKCGQLRDGKSIGGYAIATSTERRHNTIVLCDVFFSPGQEFLAEIEKDLNGNKEKQKDPRLMGGKAQLMIHELAHLAAIVEQYPTIVLDQKLDPEGAGGNRPRAYGLERVEKFANKWPKFSHLNADNYAWYATENYFENLYKVTPDAMFQPREGEPPEPDPQPKLEKAVNIILEEQLIGIAPNSRVEMKWLLYSVPFGTESECTENPGTWVTADGVKNLRAPPFPAGTFKIKTGDGDCEYKNDGKGNPGALWCNGKGHSCKAHRNKDKPNREGEKYCWDLMKKNPSLGQTTHRGVVSCLMNF
ncbi:hypothetical protein BGZ60DRAFT_431904 [Tricladium varicosporioides]|nr:hypothetical protein BGZ60DRAFT_431904 [Hymenoscyphus varicosporioides]